MAYCIRAVIAERALEGYKLRQANFDSLLENETRPLYRTIQMLESRLEQEQTGVRHCEFISKWNKAS